MKYEEKLLAKANIISASANKLWRKFCSVYFVYLSNPFLETQMQAEIDE